MNHYERLGVERDVTLVELRRAYRELAQLHHPDRNQDDAEGATRRMAAINEAFEVLSDPVRKFDYNRSLDRGVSQRPTEHSSSPDSPTRRTQRSQPPNRRPMIQFVGLDERQRSGRQPRPKHAGTGTPAAASSGV